MISLKCPTCGMELKIKEEYAGKSGKCKYCKELLKIPGVVKPKEIHQPVAIAKAVPVLETPVAQPVQTVIEREIVYVQQPRFNTARLLIVIISACGMVGTFLPWVTMGMLSVAGTRGDGWITFTIYLVIAITSLVGNTHQRMHEFIKFLIILVSIFLTLYGMYMCSNISSLADNPEGGIFARATQVGIGLYLVTLAGLFNVITLFIFNNEAKQ